MTLRHCPEILCHHCGRDYAHEYWAIPGKGDPCVCNSCRRDTNADAADAPRWVRELVGAETRREAIVTETRKQCRVCRGEWDGIVLGPPPSKGSALPFGICPKCGAEEDACLARLNAKVVPMGMPLPV